MAGLPALEEAEQQSDRHFGRRHMLTVVKHQGNLACKERGIW